MNSYMTEVAHVRYTQTAPQHSIASPISIHSKPVKSVFIVVSFEHVVRGYKRNEPVKHRKLNEVGTSSFSSLKRSVVNELRVIDRI